MILEPCQIQKPEARSATATSACAMQLLCPTATMHIELMVSTARIARLWALEGPETDRGGGGEENPASPAPLVALWWAP